MSALRTRAWVAVRRDEVSGDLFLDLGTLTLDKVETKRRSGWEAPESTAWRRSNPVVRVAEVDILEVTR